ncbi:PREDICTED: testis-expressed sequence 10 protein homolog [Atta colombica]|uniref:testis-expressed sequence 10 protein homolog n=1 Tax=Atta colombica TaxID=520822 RepID=UPI00084C0F38|nr:PREDICTED: testis-expressed sequence 10 protein homolog [Atta colombica]
MSKNHKRLKRLKSEKAKVKLKAKTVHQLTKGLNATDTSFKVKKILIREQLKQRDETEVLSTRKLNIDDLLTRFRHHNSTVRQDALKQLKDILLQNPPKSLHSRLNSLLHGIAALSLDKEKEIRTNSFHALNFILGLISNEQLTPLREIIISYLSCAMTHIDPHVKEDSLLFLDVLIQNCNSVLAKDSHKILPNFLGMICRLHNEDSPVTQLITTSLHSKSTNVKWRIKVLERLANLFISIVSYRKLCIGTRSIMPLFVKTKKYTKFIPVYSDSATQFCEINLNEDMMSIDNREKEILPTEEFVKYVNLLMPLMSDIWLEVCPDEKIESYTEITILSETAALLKNVIVIMQSIVQYIDMLDQDDYNVKRMKHWFKDTFHNAYIKNFLSRFPYGKVKPFINESRKRQKDFSQMEFTEGCLEQNLGLCQIHVWFTSLFNCNEQFPKSVRNYCIFILKYLNGIIENWYDSSTLPQLTKLLKTLFLKAGSIWYSNCINLNHTLRLIIEASSRLPNKELQSHLYLIIGDIMLNSNLNELHREKIFESYVTILPSLLLKPSIDDVVIHMISQIVLRFKEWIREELIAKHESIIENAKKIDIVGTHDDKQSRLMIYNLFYFIDSQIYY